MDTNKAKQALKKIPVKTIKTMSKVNNLSFKFEKRLLILLGVCRNLKVTAALYASKPTKSTMC